jgi:tetratricopeptide (TPR) repeat protein
MRKLTCPNPICGVVVERELIIPVIKFPDDLAGTRSLLGDYLHRVRCAVCGTVFEGRESFVFFFERDRFAAAWAPAEKLDEVSAAFANFAEDVEKLVSTDRKAVRERVLQRLAQYCLPLLMDYLAVAQKGGKQVWSWASENSRKMDQAWISALCVITKLHVDKKFWLILPGADEPLSENVLQECLDRLLGLKMPQVVGDSLQDGEDVAARLAQAIPPDFLTKRVLHLLAQQCQVLETDEISTAALVMEVALAWTAWQLNSENPRYRQWIGTVESWASSGNSKQRPKFLSQELLRATIGPEDFWDQFRDLLRKGGDSWKDVLKFALANGLFEGLSPASLLQMGNMSAEAAGQLETNLKAQLENASGSAMFESIRAVWRAGLEHVARNLAAWSFQKFLPDHPGDACWITKAICEELVRTERYSEALAEGERLEAHLAAAADAEPSAVFGLLNELGNAQRYLGAYEDAHAHYTKALELADRYPQRPFERHVVLRNIAIVLRQKGQVKESLRILKQVWDIDHLTPVERANCGESIAGAALLLGRFEEILQYVEASLKLLSNLTQVQAGLVNRLRFMAAQGYLAVGRAKMARTVAHQVRTEEKHERDQLLAGVIQVEANLQLGQPDRQLVADLLPRVEAHLAAARRENLELADGLRQGLIPLLMTLEAYDRIRSLADNAPAGGNWVLQSAAAQAAFEQHDIEAVLSYAERAWQQVALSLKVLRPELTDITVLARMAKLQLTTGAAYWLKYGAGVATPGELARAAELQNSNVLAIIAGEESQTWQRLVADTDEVIAILRRLRKADQDVVALHFLDIAVGIVPVVTAASGLEAVGSLIENSLIEAANEEFRSAMEGYNHARGGDPFARVPHWQELSCRIGASLPSLPPNTQLVIVPGSRLSDLPLHLCPVADNQPMAVVHSCCYIPNLAVLQAIRERRGRSGREATWRPSHCGAVTSWKAGDLEEAKRVLIDGTRRFVREMEATGRTVTEMVGPAATPDSFLSLARSVDLLRIACHGIGKPDEGRHGFLLGDGDVVSPGLTDYVLSEEGKRFVLEWDEIEGPTAPLVLSCSCSSGSSSYKSGGERVSLDRTLLLAGTDAYVAPFWDIMAEEAQAAIDAIVLSYINDPSCTLGETLRRYLAGQTLSHTSAALALFGDFH